MRRKTQKTWTWLLRLASAGIMLQTLFFKFTAAPESVYIFSSLGMEPWGRILVGVFELIASVLILVPRTTAYGALVGIGVMTGAIFMHLTRLGIEVQGDSGQLFIYAVLVMGSCLILAYWQRSSLSGIRMREH
ncbi:DoxX family protein [Dyadobacter fanqingshengii]|uniref:DoxX family protein n=1 Tax=Dyadobacter fanqingshengii TaxID=2906443 RepID=A0A9X1TAU5_9BACT|nr:DoxX family protein [Dyadobacter fanqingshengii]MCF0042141.1 DoxX family protein [Dyadobacter fanqingshengii]USJ35325.1 DoxX family protein [Dyadobacter fanqingshengii]